MADTKLSALTAATVANDADLLYLVQGGASKRIPASLFGVPAAARIWTAGQTFRAENIHQKAAAATGSFTFMSVDPQDASSLDWNWNIGVAANAGDVNRPDVVMNYGYNNAQGGGCDNVADDAFYIQMESYYAPGANKQFEYHLNYFGVNNTPTFRPFQINVRRHDSTLPYDASMTLNLDAFSMLDRSGLLTAFSITTRNSDNLYYFYQYDNSHNLGISFDVSYIHLTSGGSVPLALTFDSFPQINMPSAFNFRTTSASITPSLSLGAGSVYKINNVQVVGARVIDARVDDTINTSAWDATTAGVLAALRDAAVTHGWVAAA